MSDIAFLSGGPAGSEEGKTKEGREEEKERTRTPLLHQSMVHGLAHVLKAEPQLKEVREGGGYLRISSKVGHGTWTHAPFQEQQTGQRALVAGSPALPERSTAPTRC